MLAIEALDHLGIRIREKARSVSFYEMLGFEQIDDGGSDQGHPIIMRHPSGIVLNLLGPANSAIESNVLVDLEEKHTGITHAAFTVVSLSGARQLMEEKGIAITGSFSSGSMSAIFVRDPDRNVIEIDAYGEPVDDSSAGYSDHPG